MPQGLTELPLSRLMLHGRTPRKAEEIMRSRGTVASVTIGDVSKAAGVAPMTVSRYLNHHPNVAEQTARRVRDAILELGYTPNHAARMLMGQPSHVIGLIVPNLADTFFSTVAHGVEEVARSRNCLVWIAASNGDAATETLLVAQMRQHQVDGILIIPTPGTDLSTLTMGRAPLVAIDRPLPDPDIDSVVVDNRRAAQEAVEHLIWHGLTRIACIGFDGGLFSIEERISGYEDAMRLHGLRPHIDRECRTLDDTISSLQKMQTAKLPVQGLFTLNNIATMHALEAIEELEIEIPARVALIGFDDFEAASLVRPSITVVSQPMSGLGTKAAGLLFDRLDKPHENAVRAISLPTSLVIRESCGCQVSRCNASRTM